MDTMKKIKDMGVEHKLYGSVTVSPKGQVVIPASARKELGINSGDTLLVFKAPRMDGLGLVKAEAVEQMLGMMSEQLAHFEKVVKDHKDAGNSKEEEG